MNTKTGCEINLNQPLELRWLALVNCAIFRRSMIVAVVIGSILTLINQFGWVVGNDPLQLLPLILVFLLPFALVTIAQISGAHRAHLDFVRHGMSTRPESFLTTAVSHGIPARAATISLFIGSLNVIITLSGTFFRSGDVMAVSIAPLAQAYALPLLFGILSQAISYRRFRYPVVKG